MKADHLLGRTIRGALILGTGLLWGTCVLVGSRMLLDYEKTPGARGTAPLRWPSNSRLLRPAGKFTLVMLMHPNCPCSRASLAELEGLMTQLQGKLAPFVLFSKPGASPTEIQSSELWQKAAAIPGTSVVYDDRAAEAEQFGAAVSGETLLYDPKGRLAFSGGLTISRGHRGVNPGVDAVLLKVGGDTSGPAYAPVFGCALHDPSAEALRKDSSWRKP
jgi:hypothetical protein